jgi:hypothetical protein
MTYQILHSNLAKVIGHHFHLPLAKMHKKPGFLQTNDKK